MKWIFWIAFSVLAVYMSFRFEMHGWWAFVVGFMGGGCGLWLGKLFQN